MQNNDPNANKHLLLPPMSADDLRELCGLGLSALTLFQSRNQPIFFRDAREVLDNAENNNLAENQENIYLPTATSHAILAFIDTGLRTIPQSPCQFSISEPSKYDTKPVDKLTHSGIKLNHSVGSVYPMNDWLHYLLHADGQEIPYSEAPSETVNNQPSNQSATNWLLAVASSSVHWGTDSSQEEKTDPGLNGLITLGHLVPAVTFVLRRNLLTHIEPLTEDTLTHIATGLCWGITQIVKILGYGKINGELLVPRDLDGVSYQPCMRKYQPKENDYNQPPIPTYLLLNAAYAIDAILKLDDEVIRHSNASKKILDQSCRNDAERLFHDLGQCFLRRVEHAMATRDIPDDTTFDPLSLAFALRGWVLCDRGVRDQPLFRGSIAAIANRQLTDGCWPDGAATFTRHGYATQQPSVEVAYNLAAAVYTREMRTRPTEADITLLDAVIPSLQRYARFLEQTWNCGTVNGDGTASDHTSSSAGWASDRSRASRNAETWITALAVRFLHFTALIVEARSRARVLREYGVQVDRRSPHQQLNTDPIIEGFRDRVIEPDLILKPVENIIESFMKPIAKRINEQRYITRPGKNGVSLLLFGPPRSGKTYLVNQLAKSLSWPLVELDPGYFIQQGNESIGVMSARVFEDIKHLHSTVVLFDELDELVLDRNADHEQFDKNPVFMTASMLTRLARLHDTRSCLFCFATNYYHRMDAAVRGVGRFDEVLMFDRPDEESRKKFLEKSWDSFCDEDSSEKYPHVSECQNVRDFLRELTTLTVGGSFVELKGLIRSLCGHEQVQNILKSKGRNIEGVTNQSAFITERCKSILRSREDYVNWCASDGLKDLNAVGGGEFNSDNKCSVVARWQSMLTYLKQNEAGVGATIQNRWDKLIKGESEQADWGRIHLDYHEYPKDPKVT